MLNRPLHTGKRQFHFDSAICQVKGHPSVLFTGVQWSIYFTSCDPVSKQITTIYKGVILIVILNLQCYFDRTKMRLWPLNWNCPRTPAVVRLVDASSAARRPRSQPVIIWTTLSKVTLSIWFCIYVFPEWPHI